MAAELTAARGHAVRPHTADALIEAWAPTAAACYEEAVAAFVDIFMDASRGHTGEPVAFDVGPGRPEDLLVLLLEEVLFNAETRGRVPAATCAEIQGDRLIGAFTLVPAETRDVIGSIPKGVSYDGLVFGPADGRWSCRATVDV